MQMIRICRDIPEGNYLGEVLFRYLYDMKWNYLLGICTIYRDVFTVLSLIVIQQILL